MIKVVILYILYITYNAIQDIKELILHTRNIDDQENIFTAIYNILWMIRDFSIEKNVGTIISIGDSPSIFLNILNILWNKNKDIKNKKVIKFLPLSNIKKVDKYTN
jgi:hypothetical protein